MIKWPEHLRLSGNEMRMRMCIKAVGMFCSFFPQIENRTWHKADRVSAVFEM